MLKLTKKGKSRGVGSKGYFVAFQKLFAAGGMLAVLSGCSMLNIGNSDYACTGLPDGVQCMSARDVYAATNDGQIPRPVSPEELKEQKKGRAAATGSEATPSISVGGVRDTVINTYVAPQLPNKPVPIRTPAQVMRIWVAPWEDTNGDLIVTGYIYTEIEPRRWVIGDSTPEVEPVIRPLQSVK